MNKQLPMLSPDQFVITKADQNQAMGSKELKDCPFCGKWALSAGIKNPDTGNTVYTVHCSNQLKCSANTFCCSKDPAGARANAIEQWNRRKQ